MLSLSSLLKFVTGDKVLEPFFHNPQQYLPPAIAGPLNSLNSFAHRDGQAGGGWNAGGHQGGSGGGGAPAISALALLGFLFFLNLIQNSLLLNRQLMTTTVVTTGGNASASASASAGAAVTTAGRTDDVNEGRNITGRQNGSGQEQQQSSNRNKNGSRRKRLLYRPKRSLAGGHNYPHVLNFLKEKYYNMTGTAGDMDVASRISRYKIPNVKEPKMPMFPLLPPSPTYPNYSHDHDRRINVGKKKDLRRTSQSRVSSSPTSKPPDQIERPSYFTTNK